MIFNVGADKIKAQNVNYDNVETDLTSDNVQGAIDEVNSKLNGGNLEFRVENGKLQYRYEIGV